MFVDMHQHFVYGMDDGARTAEDMARMLERACKQGAERLVATPHATPGRHPFKMDRYMEHFEEARAWCRDNRQDVILYTGSEIFYTDDTPRLLDQGEIPTIGFSRNVLIEFSPDAPIERLRQAARALSIVGYQPIFAHVERYACLRKVDYARELHDDYQIVMQVNAATIASGGFFTHQWLKKMMRASCIDLVSSDAHNVTNRRFLMKEAFLVLKREYGRPIAMELCRDNARAILKNCKPG